MKVSVVTKAIEETYIGDENNDGDEIDEGDGDEGEKGGQDNEKVVSWKYRIVLVDQSMKRFVQQLSFFLRGSS